MDLFALNTTLTSYLLMNTAVPAEFVIRPVQADDVDLMLEMHQRLSTETLYKRYHTPRMPSCEDIEQICLLSKKNGRVLVTAVVGKNPKIVAVAYYIKTDADIAETAFLVEDSYQGLGLGRRLMQQLTHAALRQGIHFFDALILPSNQTMLHLLHQTGEMVYNKIDIGARDIRIQLHTVSG